MWDEWDQKSATLSPVSGERFRIFYSKEAVSNLKLIDVVLCQREGKEDVICSFRGLSEDLPSFTK